MTQPSLWARLAGRRGPAEAQHFVSALYRGLLHREADPAGLAHYTALLAAGRTPAAVVEDLLNSAEFAEGRQRHEAALAAAAALFTPPGHFYSPVADRSEADRHLAALEAVPSPAALPDVVIDRAGMIETWNRLVPFLADAPFPEVPGSGYRYGFDNPAFAWSDGSVLHAMLRHYRPRRLIEIGSGWSSACTLDTVQRHLGGQCELTFIDPYPALLRELIGEAPVRILDRPVQQVPPTLFAALEAGDILFIDSSHVLRTGSDVCFELFEILPRLKPGVVVHFHDMFWPFEYPRGWAVDENRSWNELYAVRAFLSGNRSWRVLLFTDYLTQLERPLIEATCPRVLKNRGGSLWIERV